MVANHAIVVLPPGRPNREKSCRFVVEKYAVVSYDVDGQKGKFKIDPKGNVKPYSDSEDEEGNQEDQESATAGLDPKAMSQSDLGILKTLMNPQQKRIMDTVTAGVVNSFSNFAKNLTKKLGTIK